MIFEPFYENYGPDAILSGATPARHARCYHPVEIAAVLRAARAATRGRVIAVHQPHRFTRLSSLFAEFCACFNEADTVIIADVYPAGEAPIEGVNRDALVEGLRSGGHRDARALAGDEALPGLIASTARPGDMVVCLGAGSITKRANSLAEGLRKLDGIDGAAH